VGALRLGTDDDAVRAHEVLDRRALAQELRVRCHVHRDARRHQIAQHFLDAPPVPTGTVLFVTMTL
jgi:hypothetical protein